MAEFKEIQIGENGQVYQVKDETARQNEGGYTPPAGGIPKTDLAPSVQQTLDDVANKVDKVNGKGLSTNDYTTEDKTKLGNLPTNPVQSITVNGQMQTPTNGNVNVVVPTVVFDDTPTANSDNAVKSGGIKQAIDSKLTDVVVNSIPAGAAILDADEANGTLFIYLAQAAAEMSVIPTELAITGDSVGNIAIIGHGLTQNISIVASSGFSVDTNLLTPTDANGKMNIINVSYTGDAFTASGTITITSGENVQAVNISYVRGVLPAGYQECDYIQGGQKRHINTNVEATSEIRLVTRLKNSIKGEYLGLFGMKDSNQNTTQRLEAWEYTGRVQQCAMTGCAFGSNYFTGDTTNPHTIDMSKYRLVYDGTTYLNTSNDGGSSVDWQSNYKIFIGGVNIGGTAYTPNSDDFELKIYYFKIYDGSTLVRDYIPVYETATQKYGLYDLVNGVFQSSDGQLGFSGQIKS